MPTSFRRNGLLAALLASALLVGSAVAAAPAQADGRRVAVPAAKPAWATAAADDGAVAAATSVDLELALRLPDEDAAKAFAVAVSTPGTAEYGQHLSPADWIDRFAPTQAAVDTITQAVEQAGLTVETVPKSRLFVTLTGSAAQVEGFLATRVHAYDVDGQQRIAAVGTATLPQPVARAVAAVVLTHPRITSGPQAKKKPAATPCSKYWGQHTIRLARKAYSRSTANTPLCGYSAKQVRQLTGLQRSKLDGSGQTVAVIDAFGAPSMRRDLVTYSKRNGLPAPSYSELIAPASTESAGCSPADWQVEQALDLEAVHAVAPKAHLLYVGAADCGSGFDVAMSRVLDDGLASIVSNSWGATGLDTFAGSDLVDDATRQSMVVMLHQHLQAAGQGVGLYFASGDYGDDAVVTGSTAVDFPASSPFVTAVGGTAVGLDRSGKRVFTTPWGENVASLTGKRKAWSPALPGEFIGGAGGGASVLFPAPAYQTGTVPSALAGGMRTATDVSSLAAASTGFQVGVRPYGSDTYRTAAVGGTSLATPLVAAQVALAQQASGRRLGFLNPALYALAKRTPSAFRDVVPSATRRFVALRQGSDTLLVTVDRDSSLPARRGYDLPTGLGELTPAALTALGRL